MPDTTPMQRVGAMLGPLLPARFRADIPIVPVVRLTGAIGISSPLRPGMTMANVARSLERAFSMRNITEAYRIGAEMFGWSNRHTAPGTKREGRYLVGYGVATALYPAYQFPASARVEIHADGTALAQSAMHEMGMGSATAQAQNLADELGFGRLSKCRSHCLLLVTGEFWTIGGQPARNASRSALTWFLCVVHIPCGAPL